MATLAVSVPPLPASVFGGAPEARRKDARRAESLTGSHVSERQTPRKGSGGSKKWANLDVHDELEDDENEQSEQGIHLATAVAVTVTSAADHGRFGGGLLELCGTPEMRERGMTDCSTYEIGDGDTSARGSAYFTPGVATAAGGFMFTANSSGGGHSSTTSTSTSSSSSTATTTLSGSCDGLLYASQSSTVSMRPSALNLASAATASYLSTHYSSLHMAPPPLSTSSSTSSSVAAADVTTAGGPSPMLFHGGRNTGALLSTTASSPPPHMLSFLLGAEQLSGSFSPTGDLSSSFSSITTSSVMTMSSSCQLDMATLDAAAVSSSGGKSRSTDSLCSSDPASTSMASNSALTGNVKVSSGALSQGLHSVGEVLTLEELKRRELALSEVLSEEEWGSGSESSKRVELLRDGRHLLQLHSQHREAPQQQQQPWMSSRDAKEREKEQRKREKEREKELKKLNKAAKKKAAGGSKKADSENEGRDRRDRDRCGAAAVSITPGRRRANSSKLRKSEDKDTTASHAFLTSSSSAVECRRQSTTTGTSSSPNTSAKFQRERRPSKDDKASERKARKEREKEEKARARRERERSGRGDDHDQQQSTEPVKRRRPKYSLAFTAFRNKSLSSSSLPKMKNKSASSKSTIVAATATTTASTTMATASIIPKTSPLALMPATTAAACDASLASSTLGSTVGSFCFHTQTSTSPSAAASTSLTSSSSYTTPSATSAASPFIVRKRSPLSSGSSGTKRPFIFSYNSTNSSPDGSLIGDTIPVGDYGAEHATTDYYSESEHETEVEVEKDTETMASRFFRRRGRTAEKKTSNSSDRGRSRDGSPTRAASSSSTKKQKKEKQASSKKGKKENKDHIRQSREEQSGSKSPSRRRRRSSSRARAQNSGSDDTESLEDKTDYSLTRTKSCRSQLSSSGGSCSTRLALLGDSGSNMETDKIDRLAKTEAVNEILKIELARLHEEKQKLELERLLWESHQRMASQFITPNKQVKLNIGGEIFFTSMETLRKYPNCTLSLIFTSHHFCSLPPEQQDRGYFIDRDPKHFRLILNFLRTGAMVWPEAACDRKELTLECEFYNLLDYVSILPRKEFCQSAAKLFGSPLECDQDYRKITFHVDGSFLFLLSISFTPYFPDEAPILRVQSLSPYGDSSRPLELTYTHFLAVGHTGTRKMDQLAERVHSFVLSQLDRIHRSFGDKCVGFTGEDDEESTTMDDSRRPSTASTEQLSL